MWTLRVDSDKNLAQYDFGLKGNFLAHVISVLTLLESSPKAGTNLATNSIGVRPTILATLAQEESFPSNRVTEWCRAGSQ